jgi:hypothetical protein
MEIYFYIIVLWVPHFSHLPWGLKTEVTPLIVKSVLHRSFTSPFAI